jgi:hypothetical protein
MEVGGSYTPLSAKSDLLHPGQPLEIFSTAKFSTQSGILILEGTTKFTFDCLTSKTRALMRANVAARSAIF